MSAQKIEYYDGLQVDLSNSNGTYKYVFKNGQRDCLYSPPSTGPTKTLFGSMAGNAWQPLQFFPDLSSYTQVADELIGGRMCQKFVFGAKHGTNGIMDDHIAFYWDAVLGKPVRWHMHARAVTFGSHTDEYIMDFVSLQTQAPIEIDLIMPAMCETPSTEPVSIQMQGFLMAAHARHSFSAEEASHLQFSSFLGQYGKSYAAQEYDQRRVIFESNVLRLKELNRKHAGRTKFRANQFLDMTRDEVLRFRGGKARGSTRANRRSPEQQKYLNSYIHDISKETPSSFDWRSSRPGVVGPVKDQGMCGSCWAFGAIGPIESMLAMQTGKYVELPEQFIVDCAWTNGTGSSGGNFGCDGGDSDIGALEVVRKFGGILPSASAYGSYLSINGYCKDTRLMDVGAKVTGWVDIKDRDEKALLSALSTKGPISVGIMVPDEMLFYDSGVLSVESCRHNSSEIDHAVVLVGYGTDEHGTDYYTIRNSWSTYWGDRGYINIARGDLDCAVSSEAGFPEVASGEANLMV